MNPAMLNRVANELSHTEDDASAAARPWQVDGNPTVRLIWLGLLMVLPLVAIGVRLGQVQFALERSVVQRYEQITVTIEPIPSRDGRILSADGRVLAQDVERYDIHAHYRWIEDPVDKDWLKQRALARLSRFDRRDADNVAAAEAAVLAERAALWRRLADLSGVPPAELTAARLDIQQRVEGIVELVERRRSRPDDEATDDSAEKDAGWWQAAFDTVSTTLTTPPHRGAVDPIVVQEELDYHAILEDVSHAVAAKVEAHPEEFPGFRVRVSTQRVYPERDVAPHLVGNRLPISEEELAARRKRHPDGDPLDYRAGDRIGKTGIEKSYDRQLRGRRGELRININRRGEVIDTHVVQPPQVGGDVVLTLHLPLQERAETILDETLAALSETQEEAAGSPHAHGGAIVALDVHTGEILAAASAPRFDLNLLVSPDAERWQAVSTDPARPFFSRPTQMTIAPGSVFKTLTAIALMESGRFDPDARIHCQGFLDNPDRYRCYIYRHFGTGHGDLDLTDALAQSCNVYFYSAARRSGPEPLVDWARRFGFGRPTGIDVPDERSGNLPFPPDMLEGTDEASRTAVRSRAGNQAKPQPWYPGDTLGLAIGQTRLTATPLQIARLMAAVANDGYLVTPHAIRSFGPAFDADEQDEFPAPPQPRRIAGLTAATLSRVREGLEKVVADPQGTGYKSVRLDDVPIAGKTGTAEAGGQQGDHAWFAGYVPANAPRVAFVVVLEHGGSGGRVAGPPARQLVEAMLELGVIEATRTASAR